MPVRPSSLRRPRSAVSTMARMRRLRIHTLASTQNSLFESGTAVPLGWSMMGGWTASGDSAVREHRRAAAGLGLSATHMAGVALTGIYCAVGGLFCLYVIAAGG